MMAGWGMRYLHRRMLSEYGAIISKDGQDICSGWLYQTDSKIAWIEWVVMNKESDRKLRRGAIDFLYETLFNQAKELRFEVVASVSHEKGFENMLKNKNFDSINCKTTDILFKSLWESKQ